jgi:predicted phage baseplate assembly protein
MSAHRSSAGAGEARAAENACGCCDGLYAATPVEVFNRPGLTAVQYRVGTHPLFKRTMLALLSAGEHPELKSLKTRSDDDFAVGLLDSWAVLLDILTFYQERTINESFVRTATERRSLLEQARLIGYEPRPGVAASTYLAFIVDDPTAPLPAGQGVASTPSSATGVVIEKGTKVQSIPAPGEKAQIFETVETIIGHAGWNALRPRLSEPHPFDVDLESVTIAGVTSFVKPGDTILIAAGDDPSERSVKRVVRMATDVKTQVIRLDLVPSPKPVPPRRRRIVIGKFIKRSAFLNDQFLRDELIIGKSWKQDLLLAMAFQKKWSPVAVQTAIKAQVSFAGPVRSIPENGSAPDVPLDHPALEPELNGLIAFRERAALFGHNAPLWGSLPADQRNSTNGIYKDNWEVRTLKDDQEGNDTAYIYLDRTYPAIVTGSWIALETPTAEPGKSPQAYQVTETAELSRAAYTMSAKVTRLTVHRADHFDQFRLRHTTVHVVSEPLDLAPLPIVEPISGSRLTLDRADLNMKVGQTVIVTGERSDLRDVTVSEAMTLADVTLEEGFTTLTFTQSLAHQYIRETVTINANVAAATHGETKEEILGSGDGSRAFQRLTLRQPPLTYISAPTSGGGESTLDLRVNDLRWRQVPSLYGVGPTDHAYVVQTDDDGNTTILFGDGTTGARPATGQHNIRATYRQGTGAGGNVKARQLGVLMTRPLGVRDVTNPLDAAGAADPETRDDIRSNAPLAIRTLDRIVSLQDYEDFARAFSGIGKASARWTWNGAQRAVLITVAGSKGAVVEPTSRLAENLSRAMRAAGDPFVPFSVVSHRPAFFKLAARVKVHSDYRPERVIQAVQERVRTAFAFERREFGQPIAFSELIAVLQQEPGVEAVNLAQFHRSDEEPTVPPPALLAAAPAQTGTGGGMLGAELLLLDPSPLSDIGVLS